jgi:hypothetical protein
MHVAIILLSLISSTEPDERLSARVTKFLIDDYVHFVDKDFDYAPIREQAELFQPGAAFTCDRMGVCWP